MNKAIEELKYLKYTLFHPFDAFYEIKWRGKGSMLLATMLFIGYALTMVLRLEYSSFIMVQMPDYMKNSVLTIIMTLVPLLLFIVSNWSVSTLANGKGKIKDLFMVISYSLTPHLIATLVVTVVGHFVTVDEMALVTAFLSMSMCWYYYLVFCGITTVHEYSAKDSVMMLLATAVAAIIIIFIAVLYVSLMEQVMNFVTIVAKEILRW